MISRRVFLERASWGLMTLGGAETAIYEPRASRSSTIPRSCGTSRRNDHPESPRRVDAVMTSVRALERQGRLVDGWSPYWKAAIHPTVCRLP